MNYELPAETMQERLSNAERRRAIGSRLLTDYQNQEAARAMAFDIGETFDKTDIQVLEGFLKTQDGDVIQNLDNYLRSRGYTPANNLVHLCMQIAGARNEHIEEVMEEYDSDNFGFGTAAGKDRRRRRRMARWGYNVPEVGQPADQPAETKTTPEQDRAAEINTAAAPPPETNPTREQAHAEILGREADAESYDGETEKQMPIWGAAISLGTKAIEGIKEAKKSGQKVDMKSIYELFKKKGSEVADATIKDIEKEKKKAFVKENAVPIAAAAAGLIVIGALFFGK